MSTLYTDLSQVYDAMYQTFIDYNDELNFYSHIFLKYNCTSVLEAGCGTGNLAHGFTKMGFTYYGLDLSADMLAIAQKNNLQCKFVQGDMRDFQLAERVEACAVTGRTMSYLVTNKDVYDSFNSICRNLTVPGILCFDCIDAAKFIPMISEGEKIVHTAIVNNKKYRRESFWKINLTQSWAFDWQSFFYEEKDDGSSVKIGEDNSTIRAFTKDEMILFLQLTGFAAKEIIERPSYAFDTFVIIATKK